MDQKNLDNQKNAEYWTQYFGLSLICSVCMNDVINSLFHPAAYSASLVTLGEVTHASCSSVPLHHLIHSKSTPTPLGIIPAGVARCDVQTMGLVCPPSPS